MSTAARKARKRAGEKFVRIPKVATPLEERSWWNAQFMGVPGTKTAGRLMGRSEKKKARALADENRRRILDSGVTS